jgi:hypothetical protein
MIMNQSVINRILLVWGALVVLCMAVTEARAALGLIELFALGSAQRQQI